MTFVANSRSRLDQELRDKFRDVCDDKGTMSYVKFLDVTGCHSELFGKRLFEAIDTDKSGDISYEELLEAVYILQSRDTKRRKRFIFDLFDLNHDGQISKEELINVLYASLEEGRMSLSKDERDAFVSTLLELFELDENGSISFELFSKSLELHPDILEGLTLEGIAISRTQNQSTQRKTRKRKFSSWITNHLQLIFTYSLLTLVLIGCFFWRFQRYMWNCEGSSYAVDSLSSANEDTLRCQDGRKRVLMGWSLPIAKGAGQAMKAVFTLILFPVSRNLMTNLRLTFLHYFFDFDASIDFHKVLGVIGFTLAWIHTLCHVCDIKRWSDPNRRELYFHAFPNNEQDYGRQPDVGDLLKSQVAITGIILISVFSLAALFALDYPKKLSVFQKRPGEKTPGYWRRMILALGKFLNNFNNFWYTHHLFIVFYIAMVLHPAPALPHERYEWAVSDSWVWILVPVFIYLIERITRAVLSQHRDTRVISANILPGKVIEMKIVKPRGLVYTAGQYVFLNCPQLSRFEWHPFTLTSSPGDSYLSVHIRAAGDWTQALYSTVEEHCKSGEDLESIGKDSPTSLGGSVFSRRRTESITIKSVSGALAEVIPGNFPFNIKVDGPFGAPAQNYKDYKILVLIGAGIGVTPFASVLNDLLDIMQHHKCSRCGAVNLPPSFRIQKVYFYWTLRSREEATWFKHVLEAISLQDDMDFIDINIHVSSFRRSDDVRVMLLRLAQHRASEQGVDVVAGMRTRPITHFGRPNWQDIFQMIKNTHKHDTNHCGVFFCGPNSLRQVLVRETRKWSSKEMTFELNVESFG
eukprot:g4457.t1